MNLNITYKNYSSWSLRPWLLMKEFDIPFTETLLPFAHSSALSEFSADKAVPALVPILESEGMVIWDSLAIMEYLAESYADKPLWPRESKLRAVARSAAAEMHSGFSALRSECPMNCRSIKIIEPSDEVMRDLSRLASIWAFFAAQDKSEGDFLCGEFSILDAMYAPVMWRVAGYGLFVSTEFSRWSDAMRALPSMEEWYQGSLKEEWSIPKVDNIV
ncbi:glutathione S-transferase [Marinomonas sp. 15G1-11]|uniref:Glutathione S-transferase n=1 Tax=Marinomonas phaeophyticola TaxID=3004091 RepID=A0ABT4JRD8_9GAMM|nr:glutathione S-transferase [Marinomonas sp. 15G1-11]MCZ2720810.1 glutathione S-transferase [Marinomonas sp. 15G1-11]